ncbi:MAG: M15 family metallopeptidase [Treponema sp.]
MKKIICAFFTIISALSCSFGQTKEELAKVDMVLSKMPLRAQRELSFKDKAEFVRDLKTVLEEEKKYTQDDLPLYFLIDKKHHAPKNYEPKNLKKLVQNNYYNINRSDLSLRPDVEENLKIMAKAAQADGITLLVSSTYRSYDYQAKLFQRWVEIDGLEEAERESARPGTSQHQLGSAIDFGSITNDFINTKQGKWLRDNAHKYGWSLSFPQEYEDITGYRYECWHYRFIGIPACQLQRKYFNNVQQYMLEFIDLWKNS